MMSAESIRELNREMAEVAAREGRRPFEVLPSDWRDYIQAIDNGRGTPKFQWLHLAPEFVEELYPGEYEVVETFFVDKTGWNPYDAGGPAMSIYQLMSKGLELSEEHGTLFATIHDEGQFQIHITLYIRGGYRQAQEEFPWVV